jgi:oligoendopeptidase F
MKKENNVTGVNWDLSDLYLSLNDPKIEEDKKIISEKTLELENKFKGKINSSALTADTLISFFIDLEFIYKILNKISSFSSNSFNINTNDKELAKFYQSNKEFISEISSRLSWADLEVTFAPEEVIQTVLKNQTISTSYREHIESLRALKLHRLSEAEEQLLTKLTQSGSSSFRRFYNETFSSLKFPIKENKKVKQVSYGEITSVMGTSEKREKRKEASESLSRTLKENSKTFSFILNSLLLDKKIIDEIRKFSFPQEDTLLSYRVDKKVVDALVSATQKYYFSVEKFYKHKAKIQKIKKLSEFDRYSKILPAKQTKVSWEEAKTIVLKSFNSFSPEFSRMANEFFDNNWIDSKVTEGKTSGAYCSATSPSYHPLVLMNFTGRTNDVFTLAHELGHGIHDYLSKNLNLLSYYPSIATAEIASVFAEMVTFEYLLSQITDKDEKINLLGEHLQSSVFLCFYV